MNFKKFSDPVTLIANLGVLIGLIFLIIEVRQNSDIARTSEYRENVQSMSEYRGVIASDEELFRLWRLYVTESMEELSDAESARIRFMLANMFSIYESAHFAWQSGIIDDAGWSRFEEGACPHFERITRTGIEFPFTSDALKRHLETTC